MPWADSSKNIMLDAAMAAATHVSLHTAYSASGANEVTGGSPAYARQSNSFGAASGGAVDSDTAPEFNVPGSTTVAWRGLWSASTAGTFYGMFPLHSAANNPKIFQGTAVDDTITSLAHGFSDTDTIVFFGDNLPTGITEGTIYYVRDSATDSFAVAATSGGTAINLTADGFGVVQRITPETFAGQGTYTLSDADHSANLI